MATEPVVKAQASQVAVAVSTVVIFELSVFSSTHGFSILTLLRVGYLLVKKLLRYLRWFNHTCEVAQVVAVGHSVVQMQKNAAVISKNDPRDDALAPFLNYPFLLYSKRAVQNSRCDNKKKS